MKKRILSLTLALCLLLSLLPGTAWAAEDHTSHPVCGKTDCSHTGHSEVSDWKELTSQMFFDAKNASGGSGSGGTSNGVTWTDGTGGGNGHYTLAAGSYYLSADITNVTDIITISGEVNLCLNGQNITGTANHLFTVASGATLNICDCQSGGKATAAGAFGRLDVPCGGKANLYGVTINYTGNGVNTVSVGNGNSSDGDAVLTVDRATIQGKAGIDVSSSHGKVTVKSGTITGTSYYGIRNIDGTVIVEDGTITGKNQGISNGGGGTLTVQGGTITGTTEYGISSSGTFNLKGNPTITGAKADINLNQKTTGGEQATITLDADNALTTTDISVNIATIPTKDAPVAITGSNSKDESEHFTSANDSYGIKDVVDASDSNKHTVQLYLLPHNHKVCGAGKDTTCTHTGDAHADAVEWTPLTSTTNLSNDGNFYLTKDLGTTSSPLSLTIDANKTVSLCLNGHTLTGSITNNGTLNLCNCKTSGGIVSSTAQPVTGSGTWNFYGGTIEGNPVKVGDTTVKVTNPSDGTVSATPSGGITIPAGSTVEVEKGGATVTVTVPADGDAATVNPDTGAVTVPAGGTVGTNPKITVPAGSTVNPTTGEITVPSGSTVTVTKDGKTTEITVPSSGNQTLKPTGDGKVEVPDGSKVQNGTGTEITVGPGNKGTVDPTSGAVTVPSGGKVTIPDGSSGTTTITVPSGGEVKPGADGGVVAPGGSTVTKPGGGTATVPDSGGTVKPDGTVTGGGDTPTPDDDKLDSGETVQAGGAEIKRTGDTVTITPSNGDPTTITVPSNGEVTVDKDTGAVTVPENSKVKTGDSGTEITLPSGGDVTPDGTVTVPDGGKVTLTDGANTTTITPPKGGSVTPSDNGVHVDKGTTVQTGTGPVITLPETGDGGTVKPGGSVEGSPVKVGDNTVTLSGTDPSQGMTTTDKDGNVTLPGGTIATVTGKDGNEITVTVPTGGSATVSKDGNITLPSGGSVTVPGKDGGITEIKAPSGGGTVEKNGDGSLTAPAGSTVTTKDDQGNVTNTQTAPSGGQTVTPGGGPTPPAPTQYTVTFDSNGGSAVASQTVSKGGKAGKPADPTREGYTFKGWYADAAFNAAWNFGTVLTGNLTLYAKWEKNPVIYTVTFDANGGSTVASQTVESGKLAEKPASPTWSGHTFLGWTVTKNGGDFWQFKTAAVTTNMTLYAKWEANSTSTQVNPGDSTTTSDGTKVEGKPDGTVTITPPSSGEDNKPTTVTPPSSGDKVTVDTSTGDVNIPNGSEVTIPGNDSGDDITVKLPDGGKVDGDGNITLPDGGDAVTVPGADETETTITAPDGGGTIQPDKETGGLKVPDGSTVQSGANCPEITVPNGGKVDPGTGEITVFGGSTVTVPDGNGGKTEITVPSGGESTLKPTSDGKVEVPEGSTVTTQDGTKITVTDGDNPVVEPNGTVTVPSGGKVTVTTPDGKTQTINVPAGGSVDPSSPITPPAPPISGGSSSGGGSDDDDEPTYRPTVEKTSHGDVTIRPSNPEQGDRVTITVKPKKGYKVDKVTVTDRDGDPVKVKDNGDGTYTFTQPKGKVSIEATFRAVQTVQPVQPAGDWSDCRHDSSCLVHAYTDADPGAWYHDGVHYCLQNGLMGGFTDGTFKPDATLSRAQLAQILYNLEGRPAFNGASSFTDVANNAWCANAVIWANQNGIVGGYGNGKFGPNDPITREQLATMLWRYAKAKGYDVSVGENTNILIYKDSGQVHEYAVPALQWATGAGVVNGKGGGLLDPIGRATRAQAAVMLQRYLENATH